MKEIRCWKTVKGKESKAQNSFSLKVTKMQIQLYYPNQTTCPERCLPFVSRVGIYCMGMHVECPIDMWHGVDAKGYPAGCSGMKG